MAATSYSELERPCIICHNICTLSKRDICILCGRYCDICSDYLNTHVYYDYQRLEDADYADKVRAEVAAKQKRFKEKFIPGYHLVIYYKLRWEEHDGYCSDPGDIRRGTRRFKKKYPLGVEFKDFMGRDNIDHCDSRLDTYSTKDECHGNGYCGLKSVYTIIKVKIIKVGSFVQTSS